MESKKKKSCEEAALNKLSYRMRTEKEIRDYLIIEEYEPQDIEATLKFLKESKYIDDQNYICEFYQMNRLKNWSDNRILRALSEKGIDREMARLTIEDFKDSDDFYGTKSDSDAAMAVAQKMIDNQISDGKPIDDKFLAKIGRRLASLGYNSNVIYGIIKCCKKSAFED